MNSSASTTRAARRCAALHGSSSSGITLDIVKVLPLRYFSPRDERTGAHFGATFGLQELDAVRYQIATIMIDEHLDKLSAVLSYTGKTGSQ